MRCITSFVSVKTHHSFIPWTEWDNRDKCQVLSPHKMSHHPPPSTSCLPDQGARIDAGWSKPWQKGKLEKGCCSYEEPICWRSHVCCLECVTAKSGFSPICWRATQPVSARPRNNNKIMTTMWVCSTQPYISQQRLTSEAQHVHLHRQADKQEEPFPFQLGNAKWRPLQVSVSGSQGPSVWTCKAVYLQMPREMLSGWLNPEPDTG